METLGIIVAVDFECCLIQSKIKNVVKKSIDGVNIIEGLLDSRHIALAVSGMGEINATVAAMVLSANYDINCILNFGSCGSHDEELNVGDIIVVNDILNGAAIKIDEPSDIGSSYIQIGNPKFFSFEFNGNALDLDAKMLKTDEKLSQRVFTAIKASEILKTKGSKAVYENITSSDNWNTHKKWLNYLHLTYGSFGEEMEANGIANVCFKKHIPFVSIKVVSNNEILSQFFDKTVCEPFQHIILECDIINKVRN